MAAVTRDTLFGGRVAVTQPSREAKGYRVNVDAVLLAAFASRLTVDVSGATRGRTTPARDAYDLGSGVGGVALSLLFLGGAVGVTLVEIDAVLASLAAKNLDDNGWLAAARVVRGDVADVALQGPGRADLVVCNPPYVPPGRGRAPLPARAVARSGSLDAFVSAARALVGRRGRACFVYPAPETATLLATLRTRGLEPKRVSFVHAKADAPARVALVEAVPGKAGGLVVEPPLVERSATGPSPWLTALVAGDVRRASEGDRARSRRPSVR